MTYEYPAEAGEQRMRELRRLTQELHARQDEIDRLREENRALRDLLLSKYQGEYRYDSDRAIDAAVAAVLAGLADHER